MQTRWQYNDSEGEEREGGRGRDGGDGGGGGRGTGSDIDRKQLLAAMGRHGRRREDILALSGSSIICHMISNCLVDCLVRHSPFLSVTLGWLHGEGMVGATIKTR